MGAELEKVFSPEVLEAFDERVRRIALEVGRSSDDEWLDVEGVMAAASVTEHAAREIIRRLKETSPRDVYQPNGPGTRPLVVRRSALKGLGGSK